MADDGAGRINGAANSVRAVVTDFAYEIGFRMMSFSEVEGLTKRHIVDY